MVRARFSSASQRVMDVPALVMSGRTHDEMVSRSASENMGDDEVDHESSLQRPMLLSSSCVISKRIGVKDTPREES